MNSRAVKATLAMVPVLAAAGGLLWLMYAPTGYRYEFEVVSASTLDAAPQSEQHWRGHGAERAGGGLFFKANESAIMTERAGVMPLLADTARWVRESSTFREHPRIEVIAENVDLNGYSTQQRLITSFDTLFVVAKRDHGAAAGEDRDEHADAHADADADPDPDPDPDVDPDPDADDDADVRVEVRAPSGATAGASAGGRARATAHVDTVTVVTARGRGAAARARAARRDRASRERRFVRATHIETYVWTTEDIDAFVGRSFERFADSLVMLAAHRTPRAIRQKHSGQENGPFRGVALRVVSTAVTVDSLGRRREVVTRAEIRDLRKDRNGVAYVHRRKLANVDRRLSASPPSPVAAPAAPAAPAAVAAPAPVAATRP